MKLNPVLILISFALAALIAYGFYSGNNGEFQWLITLGSGIFIFITLAGITGINFGRGGTGNVRVLSTVFFIIAIISNLLFTFVPLTFARYIIVNGIIFLIYILIGYSIVRALK
jgi:hypothetical protein